MLGHAQDTNKVIGEVTGGNTTALFQATIIEDKSDPGYCLRCVEAEAERFFAARELSAHQLRLLRILLHGTLVLGSLTGDEGWGAAAASVVHSSYTTEEATSDPGDFFRKHFFQDWAFLQDVLDINHDECALLLHEALLRTTIPEEPSVPTTPTEPAVALVDGVLDRVPPAEDGLREGLQEGVPPPVAAAARQQLEMMQADLDELLNILENEPPEQDEEREAMAQEVGDLRQAIAMVARGPQLEVAALAAENAVALDLTKPADRLNWENSFVGALGDLLKAEGKAQRLRDIESKYSQANDEGAIFKDELLERYNVSAVSADVRRLGMPGLWLYKRPFTFDHFEASFMRNPALAEQYPVLSELFKKQSELMALRHLPQVFRWLELLMERLDKRIDRMTARETSVGALIDTLPPRQAEEWRQAFSSFEEAWRLSWHRIEAFDCQPVPAVYKEQQMNRDVVVAFSLPGPSDEGMCPDFLAQHLVTTHNEFVQCVDQALLLRNQDVQRHATRTKEVQSSFMTQAHALEFALESEFVPYVEKQCVSYSQLGETDYDYAAAEKFLDRYFRNKPLLNLRLRGFNYADEQAEARASLGSKVAQMKLPHALATRIRAQVKNTAAAMHTLETVINFLSATLSAADSEARAAVGERNLGQYHHQPTYHHQSVGDCV